MSEHGLTKSIWTDSDFDVMGWHDARLYCFTVFPESFEMVLDLDYIAKWVHPVRPEEFFSFWVSPVTLVFRDVQNIVALVEMEGLLELEVFEVRRAPSIGRSSDWRWTLALTGGEISLDASGYTQYFRREPVLRRDQHLGFDERGGISYERTAYDRGMIDGA